jgi:DNA helicase II / ATP-dependent DNA helicase PcrA
VAGEIANLFLVNAPAGSGKTTTIKKMISEIILEDKKVNVLCITYTNRAADELMKGIEEKNIQIQTIHSFISSFMSIYFSHKEILNLFFEIYGDEIKKRIKNDENNLKITESNNKYKEKFGDLNYEAVKENLKEIQYNELMFNSLYYGGLSHDDLLSFSKKAIEKYKKISQRISKKYKYIFIDEYQDTSSSILEIFYNATRGTNTKLYLLGDKMQQIYKNYDGSFECQLSNFDTTIKLDKNFRSTAKIVNLLNYIYNDKNYEQHCNIVKNTEMDEAPRIVITKDIKSSVDNEEKNNPAVLKLFVFNQQRFNSIGAGMLFNSISNMERYGYGRKYGVVDVLTDSTENNPEKLLRILFKIDTILRYFNEKKYGLLIQYVKKDRYFNKTLLEIKHHLDKVHLKNKIEELNRCYISNIKIKEILEYLFKNNYFIENEMAELFDNDEYKEIFEVELSEFRKLCIYLEKPKVSTQHGVKGEGHDSVCFIAENSSNPSIKIYDFFKLWSEVRINFTDFQKMYYDFLYDFNKLEDDINMKISEMNSEKYIQNQTRINEFVTVSMEKYKEDIHFIKLLQDKFKLFLKNPTMTNAKKCLNLNSVYGVLSAYKLFYVGCSRARKNLCIIINENEIEAYKDSLVSRFKSAGFKIE